MNPSKSTQILHGRHMQQIKPSLFILYCMQLTLPSQCLHAAPLQEEGPVIEHVSGFCFANPDTAEIQGKYVGIQTTFVHSNTTQFQIIN